MDIKEVRKMVGTDPFPDLKVARIYGTEVHCPCCGKSAGYNLRMTGPTYLVCVCRHCSGEFLRLMDRVKSAKLF